MVFDCSGACKHSRSPPCCLDQAPTSIATSHAMTTEESEGPKTRLEEQATAKACQQARLHAHQCDSGCLPVSWCGC